MANLITERQAAKLALLMQDKFGRLIGALPPGAGELEAYYSGLSREIVDIFREMAKPEPDLAKIQGWVNTMLEDEQESEV